MLRPLVVLWLAAPSLLPAHRADIVAWAGSSEHSPVWPEADLGGATYDRAIAEDAEALLEEARTAAPSDRVAFERLEQLLFGHPELPQAAWLLAERHAIEAQHAENRSGAGQSHADVARQLEGPRAVAFGLSKPDAAPQRPPALPLQLSGIRPSDRVFVDGSQVEPAALIEAGRHHVQVFRGKHRISAAWVSVASPPVLALTDPTRACGELDLLQTRAGRDAPEPAAGVLCAEWAVARPNADGGTSLAFCRGSRCEPWQTRSAFAALAENSARPGKETMPVDDAALPSWVTWGAIGLGSVIATGLVLWQVGAFDSPASGTEFTFTGPTAAAIQF